MAGGPISSNAVARLLNPFGIEPGYVGDRKKDRGYEVKQFEEAFTRYLPPLQLGNCGIVENKGKFGRTKCGKRL